MIPLKSYNGGKGKGIVTKIAYDYFYGAQAEQFTFYRLPKMLITDPKFKKVSSDAKILYGVMLERMSLSMKNRWIDADNRVYIIFTLEDVMETFACSERKAGYLLSELDTKNGIGLVEKKRQGLGKPNLLYLKNFVAPEDKAEKSVQPQSGKILQVCAGDNPDKDASIQENGAESGQFSCLFSEMDEAQIMQDSGNGQQSGSNLPVRKGKIIRVRTGKNAAGQPDAMESGKILPVLDGKNQQSQAGKIMQIQNSRNVPANNKNNNKINESKKEKSIYPSIRFTTEEVEACREAIKTNIEYDYIRADCRMKEEEYLDELVELIVEAVCIVEDPVKIGGKRYPYEIVKDRLLKLDASHIRYILQSLHDNTTKVKNIRGYLLTSLMNAALTISHAYQAEVNYDLNNPDINQG